MSYTAEGVRAYKEALLRAVKDERNGHSTLVSLAQAVASAPDMLTAYADMIERAQGEVTPEILDRASDKYLTARHNQASHDDGMRAALFAVWPVAAERIKADDGAVPVGAHRLMKDALFACISEGIDKAAYGGVACKGGGAKIVFSIEQSDNHPPAQAAQVEYQERWLGPNNEPSCDWYPTCRADYEAELANPTDGCEVRIVPTAEPAAQVGACGVCDGPNTYDPDSGVCTQCQDVAEPVAQGEVNEAAQELTEDELSGEALRVATNLKKNGHYLASMLLTECVRRIAAKPRAVPDVIAPRRVIELSPAEIQSGLDRVRWAEGLIRQLPEDHDGRNSWLLNYAAPQPGDS